MKLELNEEKGKVIIEFNFKELDEESRKIFDRIFYENWAIAYADSRSGVLEFKAVGF